MRISDHNCKFFKSNDILNLFLADVRKHPVPSIDEEEEIVERYRNGDERAKDELIVGNLRFIYSIAKIYARNESEVMDYVNEGVIGLETALKMYDPSRGYKFITYGVWYIRRQMNYYLLTKRDLISHSAQVGNITKKSDVFRHESGISSIDEDLSEDYTVEESSEFNERTSSVNEYEEESEKEYNLAVLKRCLSVLPEKTAEIVKMRYGIGYDRPWTPDEISDYFGINPERVDKICAYAVVKMRKVPVKVVI